MSNFEFRSEAQPRTPYPLDAFYAASSLDGLALVATWLRPAVLAACKASLALLISDAVVGRSFGLGPAVPTLAVTIRPATPTSSLISEDLLKQSLGAAVRVVRGGLGKYEGELFASVSAGHIGLAADPCERLGELLVHLVAFGMAELAVDPLEMRGLIGGLGRIRFLGVVLAGHGSLFRRPHRVSLWCSLPVERSRSDGR